MKILSFGSLNCDYTYEVEHFLAPKETLAAKSMQRGFGGKGANQSIAFARSGASGPQTGESGKEHRGHRPGQRHEISVYADVPAEIIKTRRYD